MPKRSPKDDPHLFFLMGLVDLDCNIQDLKLLLKKTEEIKFKGHPDELINDIFPDITRNSFIVSLIIALEAEFKIFCSWLKEIENISLKWNELRGSSLNRFICYCEKLSNLKVCNDNTSRQLIKGLIEARNCIIHNDSHIEFFGKAKEVIQFAESVPGISIEDGHLTFSYEACLKCADIMHDFMLGAYHVALEKYPEN